MEVGYISFIFYIINAIYAFTYHGVLIGFINILVPYAFIWDFVMKSHA